MKYLATALLAGFLGACSPTPPLNPLEMIGSSSTSAPLPSMLRETKQLADFLINNYDKKDVKPSNHSWWATISEPVTTYTKSFTDDGKIYKITFSDIGADGKPGHEDELKVSIRDGVSSYVTLFIDHGLDGFLHLNLDDYANLTNRPSIKGGDVVIPKQREEMQLVYQDTLQEILLHVGITQK
jgi:hypothetical protein